MSETNSRLAETEVEDGKNRRKIKCQFCRSIILNSKSGTYATFEFDLPVIKLTKKSDKTEDNIENVIETEKIRDFWLVKDIYTFENIGVSNTVDNKKYLSCADCEVGPLGYHDLNTKESYLALSRVEYI